MLDELLDPRSLYHPLTRDELQRELAHKLDSSDVEDTEQLMIALRQFKQANVLRVAAADLSDAISIMVVSDYLTYIAETVVDSAMRHAWRMTARRDGESPGARGNEPDGFGVIAYGKLGGLELGYGSDWTWCFSMMATPWRRRMATNPSRWPSSSPALGSASSICWPPTPRPEFSMKPTSGCGPPAVRPAGQ